MLVEKKQCQIDFAYRGLTVIMVAANGLLEAVEIATKWFLETRKPDMEWEIVSAKLLASRIVYESE